MFRWYQRAERCYVYLSDVSGTAKMPSALPEKLSKSQWFTRGWTLQELLAPAKVEFYTKHWRPLGSKSGLCDVISKITGIEKKFLIGERLETASAAKKMSWASNRQTSRPEDTAYSLLGIFDVNMPLIYGEGNRAFLRLQHEIMKASPHDHTLFAWGEVVEMSLEEIHADTQTQGGLHPKWDRKAAERSLYGLLAESPRDFMSSGSFVSHHAAARYYQFVDKILAPPTIIQQGVLIELPLVWCYGNKREP